jgi:hypothetical protein
MPHHLPILAQEHPRGPAAIPLVWSFSRLWVVRGCVMPYDEELADRVRGLLKKE